MIYTLITFGGILFWCLTGVYALALVYATDNEDFGMPMWLTVIFGAIIVLFSNTPAPAITLTMALVYGAGYLVVGAAWALVRWHFFLGKVRKAIDTAKEAGKTKFEIESILAYQCESRSFPPSPAEQGVRIWTWFVFWPASIVTKPVRFLTITIYDAVTKVMSRMSARAFAGVEL